MKNNYQKFISWVCTPFFLSGFAVVLLGVEVLFRLSQFLRLKYNYDLFYSYISTGSLFCLQKFAGLIFEIEGKLPATTHPVVIVSNHQSMFDIPFLNVALKPLKLRFVAKTELARKIPAISIALREGGHALIDRSQGSQAVLEIQKMARASVRDGFCISLFPEGTRSRDGKLRQFKQGGMETIVDTLDHVCFLPVAISGSWEIVRYGFMPVVHGVQVKLKILEPVEVCKQDLADDYCARIRTAIEKDLTLS